MIGVRGATSSDLSAILGLLHDLGRPDPANDDDAQRFAQLVSVYITDPDKRLLVAESGGVIAGLVSVVFLTRLNRSGLEMYIPELVCGAGHRRCGIGRALVEACVNLAQAKQCHRIRLESGNQRGGSHSFYKRLGFCQSALSFELLIPK